MKKLLTSRELRGNISLALNGVGDMREWWNWQTR